MDAIIFPDNQLQCLSAKSNVCCANCILVKEQLHSSLLELKSARTIISLLRDDINKTNAPAVTNIPKPSLSCELNVYEQAPYISGIKVFNHLPQYLKTLDHISMHYRFSLKRFWYHHSFYSMEEYYEYKENTAFNQHIYCMLLHILLSTHFICNV